MRETRPVAVLETVVLVAAGGFAGANLRFLVGRFLPDAGGTLLGNAVGSFALGFLVYEAIHVGIVGDETRLAATTGLLSSFTTYSTFAVETAQLRPTWAVANVVASYTLGFAGVLVGRALARRVDWGEP
jgi:CrcB protein